MMILLLAAVPAVGATAPATPTVIEAERAFAADAQKMGQWSAFREYAAEDAQMFLPQPVRAHDFLKDRKDPPVAVFWWPGRSYISCDGTVAVNTGPWVREWGKSVGYFTTVWQRQTDGGWKWIYDAGDSTPVPRAEGGDIQSRRAACPTNILHPGPQREVPAEVKWGGGSSTDGSLRWTWTVEPNGARRFLATMWDGTTHRTVVEDKVAASK